MDKIRRINLTFSCSQYLSITSPECNKLHGHNYKVNVILKTENMVDFKLIKEKINELDHVILAPKKHKSFWSHIQTSRANYIKTHGGEMSLPRFVVIYLPVEELTVEEIGKYLRRKLEILSGVQSAELELFETDDCSAIIDEDVQRD